jgi:hypothetical protein
MLAAGFNHVVGYGQSLSTGWEGWPALSVTPGRAWMVGDSVRAGNGEMPLDRWQPAGGRYLSPIRATVQRRDGTFCSDEHLRELTGRMMYLGETPLESACNMLAASVEDPAVKIVASSSGVGGKTLAQLSCGATPEIFNRLRECCLAGREAAERVGEAYQLSAIVLLQGESDYIVATPYADYLDLLRNFLTDLDKFVERALGQSSPVTVFSYQTSSLVVRPHTSVDIGQAQLDFSLETSRFVIVSPSYFVTNKGIHLDANGYRWIGSQFGKVMVRRLVEERSWAPLQPKGLRRVTGGVEIDFLVPVPPLAWGRPFRGRTEFQPIDRGFRVTQGNTELPIDAVEIVGTDRVFIRLNHMMLDQALMVTYADGGNNGGAGCLHDSDASTSGELVSPEDMSSDHMGKVPAHSDLALLFKRTYPMPNWCLSFKLSEGSSIGSVKV